MKHDLIVIGAGPAGYVAAIRAAQLDFNTVVVEKANVGGVCLNAGCIPTKQLFASASVVKNTADAESYGLCIKDVEVDAARLQKNKKKVVRTLSGGITSLLKANGVNLVQGRARIVKSGLVEVETDDGIKETISAAHILIATGSGALPLPIKGGRSPVVVDSTGLLELAFLPKRLVIIGAGVIGVEFAAIYRAFGVDVTLVESLPDLLPELDREVAAALKKELSRQGIRIILEANVEQIAASKEGAVVTVEGETIACDLVLNATGRTPHTEGLGLAELGVETDAAGFIRVNEDYETSVPGIYAAGDVIGGLMLAHVASAEACAAVERMTGRDSAVDYELVPQSVFSFPEYSLVGLTEEKAKEKYSDIAVSRFHFRGNGKALSMNADAGFVKIIATADLQTILGVHILGPHASDLITEAAAAMNAMLTVEEYANIMRVHPTLAEALFEAASELVGKAVHVPPRRKKRGEK